ncbi:hypothetical protein MHUMG1_07581 [Metarhizium humberi]|uniref:Uncharacterized protein n=1 Tax=Metarhizium humberi TaxID=2596975 RepID=A0A9P8M732_9HYPO|nr:hypothetical protein MHUMG1_07581 [Metarhizium humberi]
MAGAGRLGPPSMYMYEMRQGGRQFAVVDCDGSDEADVLMGGPRRGATTGANRRHGRAREMTRGNGAPLAERQSIHQMVKSSITPISSGAALATGPRSGQQRTALGVNGFRVAGQQKKEKTERTKSHIDSPICHLIEYAPEPARTTHRLLVDGTAANTTRRGPGIVGSSPSMASAKPATRRSLRGNNVLRVAQRHVSCRPRPPLSTRSLALSPDLVRNARHIGHTSPDASLPNTPKALAARRRDWPRAACTSLR